MYTYDHCGCCGKYEQVRLEYINKLDEATLVCDACLAIYKLEEDEKKIPRTKRKKFVWKEV